MKLCKEGPDLSHVSSIKWGKDNEANALSCYKEMMLKTHDGIVVERTGLKIHEDFHFLGASPDGIGNCECHGKFLIEIKCPSKHKDKETIEDCISEDKTLS